jgi:lipoate-protein ligase A
MKMRSDLNIEEEQFIERVVPRIEERIRHRIIQNIVDALEEQFYPPEEMIREEFIKSVEEAGNRVKEGKAKSFKDINELTDFLNGLKDE